MAVDYNVIENALTSPPTFKCVVAPKTTLNYDEVAIQINLHNPTIPATTARTVLEAFRAEVKLQLLAGNTVKLANFVSFSSSMSGRLDVATDPLPIEPLRINGKISSTLMEECKTEASYNRLGYPTKAPSVVDEFDTNTGIHNLIRAGFGMQVQGKYIGFDQTDSLQGIFLTATDVGANVARQTNISLAEPSRAIAVAVLPTFSEQNSVEMKLSVATKYTVNGSIRATDYSKYIRTINEVDNTNRKLFMINGVSNVTMPIATSVGPDLELKIRARIKPDNTLALSAGTLTDDYKTEVPVATGDITMYYNDTEQVTITIDDYGLFFDQIKERNRYVEEVGNFNISAS